MPERNDQSIRPRQARAKRYYESKKKAGYKHYFLAPDEAKVVEEYRRIKKGESN